MQSAASQLLKLYLHKLLWNLNRLLFIGFHVDDSEVTLNVCLGKQFYGGELFFRGVRCDKHVNSETQPEVCSCPTLVLLCLFMLDYYEVMYVQIFIFLYLHNCKQLVQPYKL